MKKTYKLGMGLGALLLVAAVDLPQTVRLKDLVVKLLPLEPATTNSVILSWCQGAHAECVSKIYDWTGARMWPPIDGHLLHGRLGALSASQKI